MVGSARFADESVQGFRWSEAIGFQFLDQLPSGFANAVAQCVSADGQVIAGSLYSARWGDEMGFRWTETTGMTTIGSLVPNPPFTSRVNGISGNGLVLVGASDPNENFPRAVRWTNAAGMHQVYAAPGTGPSAHDASANGAVVVGYQHGVGFRWTGATGAQEIPDMQPHAVSGDGSVLAGYAYADDSDTFPAIWTQTCGTRNVHEMLREIGVPGLERWQITHVWDIADDNRTLVGFARNADGEQVGCLARMPKAGDMDFDGLVDADDLLIIILSWGPCPSRSCVFMDVNCDGVVAHVDLLSVIDNWDR
jgi:uncharacterized membrane protein